MTGTEKADCEVLALQKANPGAAFVRGALQLTDIASTGGALYSCQAPPPSIDVGIPEVNWCSVQ